MDLTIPQMQTFMRLTEGGDYGQQENIPTIENDDGSVILIMRRLCYRIETDGTYTTMKKEWEGDGLPPGDWGI